MGGRDNTNLFRPRGQLCRSGRFPKRVFSGFEVRLELVGDRHGQQWSQVLFNQLDRERFRATQARKIERRCVFLPAPAEGFVPFVAHQRVVYEALLQDRQIEAVYQKRGDPKPSNYTLQPLAIVQRGALTYLVATAFRYEDVLMFALHRFQKVEMLDAQVVRPKNFDLDDYIASGAFGFGDGKKIKLEALFTRDAAEHLYETPISVDQVLRPQSQSHTKLVATVANTPQLEWWLLGFGQDVEVISPKSLRSSLAATALAMSRKYYNS